MPVNPPRIFKMSATSKELWHAEVKGKSTTGGVQDPTSASVSAAVIRQPEDPADKRVPVTGDFVACTWETWTGPRYMVAVLMGAGATIVPEGPTADEDEVVNELWIRLVSGSEDVRFRAGLFSVTP